MQGSAMIFFLLFAVVQVAIYLGIRRRWASPGVIAGGGVLASVVVMILIALAQGDIIAQSVVVGVVVGIIFSIATLAMAWYFHSMEMRADYASQQAYSPEDTNSSS